MNHARLVKPRVGVRSKKPSSSVEYMKSSNLQFSEIYNTYEKPIFNYVLRMVQDQVDAEDLTQEVFVKIYQSLPEFRGESKISTWIYRLATNVCLDHFKKKSYLQKKRTMALETTGYINGSDTETAQIVQEWAVPPDESAIKSDNKKWLKHFLKQLPKDYRSVFILAELHELQNREIAEIMNLSLENVKIRRHRARRKLKEILEGCCTFYYDKNNQIDWDEK